MTRPSRRTTRSTMLEILAEHPKGIAPPKLEELTQKRYAHSSDYIKVILCTLRQEGTVRRIPNKKCFCCGRKLVLYVLT